MKKISQQELQFCIHVAAAYKADQTLNKSHIKNFSVNNGGLSEGLASGSASPVICADSMTQASPISQSHDCIGQLDEFDEQARKIINLTRSNWGVHGEIVHNFNSRAAPFKHASLVGPKNNCVEQLGGISDWAFEMIGWRVTAAGEIA